MNTLPSIGKPSRKIKDCDMRFALSTFKYSLPKDNNGIYNSLTKVPPYTFDELLSRVEDDEVATSGVAEQNRGSNGSNNNSKFNKSKRKIKDEFNVVSEDGFKGVNTVFTKSIHKIMHDILNQPYFEWPKQMRGNFATRNSKLRWSYHKDHGHLT